MDKEPKKFNIEDLRELAWSNRFQDQIIAWIFTEDFYQEIAAKHPSHPVIKAKLGYDTMIGIPAFRIRPRGILEKREPGYYPIYDTAEGREIVKAFKEREKDSLILPYRKEYLKTGGK